MRRSSWFLACLAALAVAGPALGGARPDRASSPSIPRAPAALGLWFEPNLGQADPSARCVARTRDGVALLTEDGAVLAGRGGRLGLRFVGAAGEVVPLERRASRSRYLTGADPSRWLTDVPHHGSALLDEALPGIDVRWRGDDGRLRFDVEVEPHADASAVRIALDGVERAHVDGTGRLVAETAGRRAEVSAPVAWQERGARREPLAARWVAHGDGSFGFAVEGRDPSARLVVDPTVHAGSLLGADKPERAVRCATNAAGEVFLVGSTASASFPVGPTGVRQTTKGEPSTSGNYEVWTDGFVAKLSSDGVSLEWATYLGGDGDDVVNDVALDSDGDLVLCGSTQAANFPLVNHVSASGTGFVARLNGTGTFLSYSSYMSAAVRRVGLDASDAAFVLFDGTPSVVTKLDASLRLTRWTSTTTNATGTSLFVDGSGDPWIAGHVPSTGVTATPDAYDLTYNGGANDALVWKLDSSDGARTYSTYAGSAGDDRAEDVVVVSNLIYVVGWTTSNAFPLSNAFQGTFRGVRDGFVMKLDRTVAGTNNIWSTYFGGNSTDTPHGLAVGPFGDVYLAGETTSTTNFPLASALQTSHSGGTNDAFVARLSANGALLWSTYLGGSGDDTCACLVQGPTGRPLLAGRTTSSFTSLLASGSYQRTHAGNGDAWTLAVEESTTPFGDVSLEVLAEEPTERLNFNYAGATLPLTGGVSPRTWELHRGALPAGLTLSTSGVLSGTVALGAAGEHLFALRVKDAQGATVVREYRMRVWGAPQIATSALAPWTVGRDMSQDLVATGGRPDLAWRLVDGTAPGGVGRLPGGLQFFQYGTIGGTPDESGDFTFGVEVTDANGGYTSGVVTFRVNEAPQVDDVALAAWTEGRPVTRTLTASLGTPPYTWSVASGSIPSAALEAATGRLTGAAQSAGDYAFVAQVRDAAGATATRNLTMRVNPPPTVTVGELPPALAERAYRAVLLADGGTGALRWATTGDGAFPVGFTLNSGTGVFTGRPLLERRFEFGVEAMDEAGAAGVRTVGLDVVSFFPLTNPKGNKIVDEFGPEAATGPVRRFVEVLAGTRLDGTFRLVGRGKLAAAFRLVDVDTGEEMDLSRKLKGKGAKRTLSNFVVDRTRRFFVVVEPEEGFVGKVETSLRARAQTAWKGTVTVGPDAAPTQVVVSAEEGSKLAISIARARRSAAAPTIVSVVDAAGNELLENAWDVIVTPKGATFEPAAAVPAGEVTITFAGVVPSPAGACDWSVKLRGAPTYDVHLWDRPSGDLEDE